MMVNNGNTSCAVMICPNVGRKTASRGVSYHRFPKKVEIRQLWISQCGRRDTFNIGASYICSDHFEECDYERDLRAELLNLPPKKRLKVDAVPSRNLPPTKSTTYQIEHHGYKNQLSNCHSANKICIVITEEKPAKISEDKTFNNIIENNNGQEEMTITIEEAKYEALEIANEQQTENDLKQQLHVLQHREQKYLTAISNLKRKLILKSREGKTLKQKLKRLSVKSHPKKNDLKMIRDEVTTILRTCFSDGQIRHLIYGAGHWTAEDISAATAMRSLSKELYEYLRSENYPFPSEGTIRRWNKLNHVVKCDSNDDFVLELN